MKIINVLKDDSFDEILELFRKAPEGEVFLVLPRNGKLFRHEDHFAAFASEASQGHKTVSLLTPNPQTATLARKFGFTVLASHKPNKKAPAALASSPPPADPDIREENDDAFSDVPMTSDATMGNKSTDSVDEDEDGKPDEPDPEELATATLASTLDGVRGGIPQRTLSPTSRAEKAAPVPVQSARELDYIDTMWREKVGRGAKSTFSLNKKISLVAGASMSRKVALGILLVSLVVLGMVVYAITGSAQVVLAPMGKPLDTQITIQASDTFTSVDDAFYKLPGQLLEVSKTASHTVMATGKRDIASKARGKITVTNAFSSTSQPLVATTRFQSSNGLVFRTLQSITVPGSTVSAGKTVPGTVVVDVVADKPGSDYNVPAGSFVIMAFVEKGDTEKSKQFYGVSGQVMSGGASGPSTVITQADYDSAQAAVVAAVKDQIKVALAAQGSTMMVIDADKPTIKEVTSSARVDDSAESVTATATGTLATIGFRSADLQELVRKSILKKDRLTVIPDKLQLAYSDITFKPDLGTLTFTVSIKGTGYALVDSEGIKRDIGGKNTQNIRDYFKDKEGIRSATVTLSPFWVTTVPQNPSKIDIEFNYDESR